MFKKSIQNKIDKLGHAKVGKLLATDSKDLPKSKSSSNSNTKKGSNK